MDNISESFSFNFVSFFLAKYSVRFVSTLLKSRFWFLRRLALLQSETLVKIPFLFSFSFFFFLAKYSLCQICQYTPKVKILLFATSGFALNWNVGERMRIRLGRIPFLFSFSFFFFFFFAKYSLCQISQFTLKVKILLFVTSGFALNWNVGERMRIRLGKILFLFFFFLFLAKYSLCQICQYTPKVKILLFATSGFALNWNVGERMRIRLGKILFLFFFFLFLAKYSLCQISQYTPKVKILLFATSGFALNWNVGERMRIRLGKILFLFSFSFFSQNILSARFVSTLLKSRFCFFCDVWLCSKVKRCWKYVDEIKDIFSFLLFFAKISVWFFKLNFDQI